MTINNPLENDLNDLLIVTPSPWEKLRQANIFLTGASGTFGIWLLESILWANDRLELDLQVSALTRNADIFAAKIPHLYAHKALTILEGDILTFSFPRKTFSHFIHLAAPSAENQKTDPFGAFDVLVSGCRRILDFASISCPKHFLYVSSGAVYGRHSKESLKTPETCLEGPDPLSISTSAYDEGKRAAEFFCSLYWHNKKVPATIARCFSFIGPYLPLNANFAVGNFIRDALAGGPIRIQGDGTPTRSFLYLADLAWWLLVVLLHGAPGGAYNVGSDEPVSISELASEISVCFIPKIEIIIENKNISPYAIQKYVPNTNKSHKELGLHPRISLKTSIYKTINWHKHINISK
jgi:dTDP-glucose 4,6-dehydratase